MKNVKRHLGTLEILRRLPSSTNGNPRYELQINGCVCRTSVVSGLAYRITNFDGKRVEAMIGLHRGAMTIDTVNLAGGI